MSAVRKPEPVKPAADIAIRDRWIQALLDNLTALFQDREDVFVSARQPWYPVEGHPEIVQAPDVSVVFGRPKGYRASYKQWEEDRVPMAIVFDVLPQTHSVMEVLGRPLWYAEHGVQEYYVLDPQEGFAFYHLQCGDALRPRRVVSEFVSPLLGIRFDLSGEKLALYSPDGSPFLPIEQPDDKQTLNPADEALKRVAEANQRADHTQQRIRRLAELGRKARRGEATAEEIAELESLEESAP